MKRSRKYISTLSMLGICLLVSTSVGAGSDMTLALSTQLQDRPTYTRNGHGDAPELQQYFLKTTDADALEVLRFWFEQWDQDMTHRGKGQFNQKWFPNGPDGVAGSREVDRVITEKFSTLFADAVQGKLSWKIEHNPYENLAYILLVDQFSRHIFRGRAEAYAHDAKALAAAKVNIAKGLYRYYFTGYQKLFVVAPLVHHEDLVSQQKALSYLKQLNEYPEHPYEFLNILESAVDHYQMILMFGRFPHRNQRHGRPNTALETAYLSKRGSKGFIDGSKW